MSTEFGSNFLSAAEYNLHVANQNNAHVFMIPSVSINDSQRQHCDDDQTFVWTVLSLGLIGKQWIEKGHCKVEAEMLKEPWLISSEKSWKGHKFNIVLVAYLIAVAY